MGRAKRRCDDCRLSWTPRARFCGRCGAPLGVPGPPVVGTAGIPKSAQAMLAVVGAGALVLTAASVTSTQLPRHPQAADEVDVRDGSAALPDVSRASPGAIGQAERAWLRCAPQGCELWRHRRQRPGPVAVSGEVVGSVEGRHLVGLDAATGAQRWVHVVGDVAPYRAGATTTSGPGSSEGPHREVMLLGGGSGMVVSGGAGMALVDRDGVRRWTIPHPDAAPERIHLLEQPGTRPRAHRFDTLPTAVDAAGAVSGGTVLSVGARQGWSAPVFAHDLATGELLWEARHRGVLFVENDAVVVRSLTNRLEVLHPRTGRLLWSESTNRFTWVSAAGDWLALNRPGTSLRHRTTGTEAAALDVVVAELVATGDRWVALVSSPPGGSGPVRVVAFDPDGEVAWDVPLETDRCCPAVGVPNAESVTISGDGWWTRLDAASGQVTDTWTSAGAHGSAVDGIHTDPDGAIVSERADGVRILTVGNAARVYADDVWLEARDPWIVGTSEELMAVVPRPSQ